jgi:hypothetical protein
MNLSGAVQAIVKASVARDCGVIALDTWVGNTDRDNGRNALFGLDADAPAEGGFVFLDSANSLNMGDRWNGDGWKNIDVPPMPVLLQHAVDRALLIQAIERVEARSDAVIDEIVHRIPDDYMSQDHRTVVVAGLRGRRALVRSVLTKRFNL